nr:hypothetical protein [Pseudomonas syringae]
MRGETCPRNVKQGRQGEKNDLEMGAVRTELIVQRLPSNLLYPKSKNHILNKYMYGTKFEPGKSVWQLYEAKNHAEIQSRVLDEVYSTHKCYELIQSKFESFKKLEAMNKRQEKLLSKAREAATEVSSEVEATD